MHSAIPTKRPRNVNAFQAAAILYGDWGTSKAYVLGLAFMVAGYSSFWLIAFASLLGIFVALNYIIVCKYYPNGGGVYASVRHRSEILAMVGGFFLIADYIVTATLSALAAFQYLGVEYPVAWASGIIIFIGILNYFGPKHTGNLALVLCIAAVIVVIALGLLTIPYLSTAIHHVQPMTGGLRVNWINFVSIIVALSGIEAIANTTGVMKLNPGTSDAKPSVTKTSTPAILAVMFEVCLFTTLFGLAMNALPGLVSNGTEVDAPGHPHVRDAMLRYMGEVFAGNLFGPNIGYICGLVISITFCLLLLSAVNTAIVALVSLIYVMSRDGELPKKFQLLNYYGVPKIPLLLAMIIPLILLFNVGTVAGLANLYAVGFIGAIATNLGSTSTDRSLNLRAKERIFMFLTFCILAAVEITLFIEKPDARSFVISILAAGLLLRGLVLERNKRTTPIKKATSGYSIDADDDDSHVHNGAILCAVTHLGKTLEFALQESKKYDQMLYILFVRVKPVITENDLSRPWVDDEAACKIFDYAKNQIQDNSVRFLYVVSDAPTQTIVETAKKLQISRVILGMPRIAPIVQMIHGNVVRDIGRLLPEEIDLVVIS